MEWHIYCSSFPTMEAIPAMEPEVDPPLDWEDMRERSVRVPGHVVRRDLVSETVLLNVQTGVYYGLDEVGGRFFTVLSAKPSVEAAVMALAAEFDAPLERIRRDTVVYCSELLARGLIELESGNA